MNRVRVSDKRTLLRVIGTSIPFLLKAKTKVYNKLIFTKKSTSNERRQRTSAVTATNHPTNLPQQRKYHNYQ